MTNTDPKAVLAALSARSRLLHSPCGDGQLTWREWGVGNTARVPVVLFHGGFGAWTHWTRNIPALEQAFRVIAVDLPGCGDSDDPHAPYDADDLAAILSAGLDVVLPDDAPFNLVSFSFGGVLSGLVAHAQARRIQSLTLIGAPILGLTGTGPANDLARIPGDMPLAEALPLHRSNLQKLMVCDPAAADDLALAIHLENMGKARLRSRGIARGSVLADSLKDLPCPLNCIFGDSDTTLAPDLKGNRDYIESLYPGLPFHVLPQVGHWAQFEAADKVNDLLDTLLAKTPA